MLSARAGLFSFALVGAFGRAFTISTDTLFYLSRGLTFSDISQLEVILAVCVMALEIPSGAIADRVGRKFALLISCSARCAAYSFVIWGSGEGSFATAFFFFGLGTAFQSGALNAWLVDSEGLGDRPELRKSDLQRQFASIASLGNIGNAAGAICGSFAYTMAPTLPWRAALGIAVLAILILALTREPRRGARIEPSTRKDIAAQFAAIPGHLKDATGLFAARPQLVRITCFASISQMGMTGVIKVWQPWFASLMGRGGEAGLGFIWSCFVVANLFSNRAVKDSCHVSDKRRLVLAAAISGVPLLAFAVSPVLWLALPLYMIHVFGEAYKDPILYGILHAQVESTHRATAESLYSFVTSLAEAIGFLIMGFVIDAYGLQTAVIAAAGLFVVSSAAFVGMKSQ